MKDLNGYDCWHDTQNQFRCVLGKTDVELLLQDKFQRHKHLHTYIHSYTHTQTNTFAQIRAYVLVCVS